LSNVRLTLMRGKETTQLQYLAGCFFWLPWFQLPRWGMAPIKLWFAFIAFSLEMAGHSAFAQSAQFWPEIDTYVKLKPNIRLGFLASQSRENGNRTDAEIGPSIDFYLKPWAHLKRLVIFELDDSKSRPLFGRFAYRVLPSTDGPLEQRIVTEGTPRFPLKAGVVLSDRNRTEFRFIDGQFSWRYRNRLTSERTLSLFGYHFSPYIRAEGFYDSKYSKWSRTSLAAGSTCPIRKHTEIDASYEHQNDTGGPHNQQVNAIALALNLYF
jgi:hypothetical protein